MFYIKMTANCDLYGISLWKDNDNGNHAEFVHSVSDQKIRDAIRIIKRIVRKNWYSHCRPVFKQGAYYFWVTTSEKGHLRCLTIAEGPIPDNVSNQKYNYFKSKCEAVQLQVMLEKAVKRLP